MAPVPVVRSSWVTSRAKVATRAPSANGRPSRRSPRPKIGAAHEGRIPEAPGLCPGTDLPITTRFRCTPPGGGVLCIHERRVGISAGAWCGKPIRDSTSFCMAALAAARVALVMGSRLRCRRVCTSFVRDRSRVLFAPGFDAIANSSADHRVSRLALGHLETVPVMTEQGRVRLWNSTIMNKRLSPRTIISRPIFFDHNGEKWWILRTRGISRENGR